MAYELAGNEHETLNAEWQWKSLLAANPQPLFLDTALELLDLHLGALAEKLLQGEVRACWNTPHTVSLLPLGTGRGERHAGNF